ncbi:MAG: hypothetical protein Q4G24_00680 [Paracoccus sp. (in: a-proteobacteria)]|uniref:hypothetical protein n=1 Tax=Paracoccus sp. TaxID=267 RepID=UPI0026DF9B10|nr:hypothetical protein [Paracoccus sp. (in: a-proteobacteria)]MDO5619962.1 hypothetical protein [Paracoccus sp. (in: a-proteobacteria)]
MIWTDERGDFAGAGRSITLEGQDGFCGAALPAPQGAALILYACLPALICTFMQHVQIRLLSKTLNPALKIGGKLPIKG